MYFNEVGEDSMKTIYTLIFMLLFQNTHASAVHASFVLIKEEEMP